MKRITITILTALILIVIARQGFGLTEFKDGGIHYINYTINDTVWVDYQSPDIQTTVNFLTGGLIPGDHTLEGYNDSIINISGGEVGEMSAHGSSHVTISSGSVGYLLKAYDISQVIMSNGTVTNLESYNTSQVTISNGMVSNLMPYNLSQVSFSGGIVQFLLSFDTSQVTMSGGYTDGLGVFNNSELTLSGGTTYALNAFENCQVTIKGGKVSYAFEAIQSSHVTMSGGTINNKIVLSDNAELLISGSNFALDGNPVGFGKISSVSGGNYWNEPVRRLTGTLANGDSINNEFQIGNYASITLIPEPATLLLLGLGGLFLRKRK